jgi:hypothetical protein
VIAPPHGKDNDVETLLQQIGLSWIKASSSYATSQCVELAVAGDMVAVRDSKRPETLLFYTAEEFNAFLDGAKRGEFDHLISPRPA